MNYKEEVEKHRMASHFHHTQADAVLNDFAEMVKEDAKKALDLVAIKYGVKCPSAVESTAGSFASMLKRQLAQGE